MRHLQGARGQELAGSHDGSFSTPTAVALGRGVKRICSEFLGRAPASSQLARMRRHLFVCVLLGGEIELVRRWRREWERKRLLGRKLPEIRRT